MTISFGSQQQWVGAHQVRDAKHAKHAKPLNLSTPRTYHHPPHHAWHILLSLKAPTAISKTKERSTRQQSKSNPKNKHHLRIRRAVACGVLADRFLFFVLVAVSPRT